MKKIIWLAVVLIIIAAAWLVSRGDSKVADDVDNLSPSPNLESVSPTISVSVRLSPSPSPSPTVSSSQTKSFNVSASNFKFSLDEIKVKKGDKVRIVFRNDSGSHDWVIEEFNAKTKQLKANESETIEFVADKIGVFEYYCSVSNHRQMGMKGKLVVE